MLFRSALLTMAVDHTTEDRAALLTMEVDHTTEDQAVDLTTVAVALAVIKPSHIIAKEIIGEILVQKNIKSKVQTIWTLFGNKLKPTQ